jgi:hypothetical protein
MTPREPEPYEYQTSASLVDADGLNKQIFDLTKHFDYKIMDSSLSYDGRTIMTTAVSMTLTTGAGWTTSDSLTLTAANSVFATADIGKRVYLYVDGEQLRVEITARTSGTVVTVTPLKTVPTAFRNVAIYIFSLAVETVSGLSHLEGRDVAVYADGFVLGSPNNEAYTTYTVTNGAISLGGHYSVVHVGLPFTTDIETLDIDSSQGESIIDKKKLPSKVSVGVHETRGLFVGQKPPTDDEVDPLEGLYEVKARTTEFYDEATELMTGTMEVNIESNWNSGGRIFIRQVDPVPMSVVAIAPSGLYPFGGG